MTDTDITKREKLDRLQSQVDDMEVRIAGVSEDLPTVFQIYLEPGRPSEHVFYYMINHDRDHRCVFWIDKLDLSYLKNTVLHSLSQWSACLHSQFSVSYDSTCRSRYAR